LYKQTDETGLVKNPSSAQCHADFETLILPPQLVVKQV